MDQTDINLDDWNLRRAASENRSDIARSLIARGDDVDEVALSLPTQQSSTPSYPKKMGTPLYAAASNNSLEVAMLLLKHGADINNNEALGRLTPLHIAAFTDSIDVANLLIEQGADIEAKDGTGWTPLYMAAYQKSFDVARALKYAGANTAGIDLSWMDSTLHKSKRAISKWWKNSP